MRFRTSSWENVKMQKEKCTAIVLAAGQGKRMGTTVQKQYLELGDKPVLYYSLRAFEESPLIDEIILVVGDDQETYCREEILEKYQFTKVRAVVQGGAERYHSVWNGLQKVNDGYVFIHDGARPFVDNGIISRAYEEVVTSKACVVGMPVKDTIKVSDEGGFVQDTPDRAFLWMIQTPQVFQTSLIKEAYRQLMCQTKIHVTDDAMAVEQMLGYKVKLVLGSYENIKITTPEDLWIAAAFLSKK